MSGVLRRGSLNFDCNLKSKSARGSYDANLYGGFRDAKPRTPEISVITLDFRRHSEDLKKDVLNVQFDTPALHADLSDDVDSDVISNYIGHVGRWQFKWTLLLSLLQIPTTFHMFTFVFMTADTDFWCARPAQMPDMDIALWRNLTQPQGACTLLNYDNLTELLNNPTQDSDSAHYSACTRFEYAHLPGAENDKTLVEEFALVCDRRWLLSVVEMCFLAGAAVGSVSSGWISDRFGRRHTLMGFATVQTLFGTILAFTPTLAWYMSLRVIVGFASMTVIVVSFVLVVELVSGKWRTIVGILNILPVALTYVLTAGIAYYVRDWRTLQLITSCPWVILLCTWYYMPESPRWLLACGRLNELYAIVERAAHTNRRILPANYQKSLEAAVPASVAKKSAQAECGNEAGPQETTTSTAESLTNAEHSVNPLFVVFSKNYWKITCLTLVSWLTLIIMYFGLTLHLSNLGGNIYLNTAIAGTVEAIMICLSIFVVLKFGLRRSLIAFMLIPGLCCLATNIIPAGSANLMGVIGLGMIAKCLVGANNAIIPTYTAMQYPTVVRNFGVGMGNLAAGIALILVPYMWLLEDIDPLLPMSIMGVCGLVGGVALLLMKDVQH